MEASPPVVLVRLARVDAGHPDIDVLLGELDDGERRRAGRFRVPLDRARFVVGHAMLARATSGPGSALGPRTVDGDGRRSPDRHVSLSHAGGLVALAVAPPGIAVGIDVEPVDPGRFDRAVALRFLPPAEVAAIDAAPPAERPRLFARAWTGLEAEAKGRRVSLDALRGSPRSGRCLEIEADPEHVVRLWIAVSTTAVRVDRRLLASAA